jgi:hypothetical protein
MSHPRSIHAGPSATSTHEPATGPTVGGNSAAQTTHESTHATHAQQPPTLHSPFKGGERGCNLDQIQPGELLATPEEIPAALLSGDWPKAPAPVVGVRPLRYGLAAVLVPRGMSRAEENKSRAALGVPPRPARRTR